MTIPEQTALDALSESRARWRDLALVAADMVFEIDANGCFVLVGPDEPFGWSGQALIGVAAETLLVRPAGAAGINPFLPPAPIRGHRAWIRRADGRSACVLVSAMPLPAPAGGGCGGARGSLQDITSQDHQESRLVQSLLEARTVREICRRMHRAVLPDMVIKIGLEELVAATGSTGALIAACDGAGTAAGGPPGLPLPSDTEESSATGPATAALRALPRILHRTGEIPPAPDHEILAHLCLSAGSPLPWSRSETRFDRRVVLSAIGTHFCEPVVMMMWRAAGSHWVEGDVQVAAGFLSALGNVLEHDQVQRELQRQSGADTLTGLLNRDSFIAEVTRRLDRLDTEGLAGTMMIVGLDRFEEINKTMGHERGDEALRQAAHHLRDAVRPTDLVARMSGDVFALWLDGADQFAAAERAESLCQKGVPIRLDTSSTLRVSVGLTTRPSRSFETIETMLEQAHAALSAIKLAGGGRWHFYNEGIGQ